MTIQVELNPEAQARLAAVAQAEGVPLEKVAERLLHEALASRSAPQGNLSVEEFHSMLDAMAQGSEKLPDLATESFTRESFYQDRYQMAGTPYLVDSNVLLRWIKPDDRDYPLVASAIDVVLGQGAVLCYTSQNVAEFWNTCTRPLDRNGYGLSPQETDRRARFFEDKLQLLPDSVAVH